MLSDTASLSFIDVIYNLLAIEFCGYIDFALLFWSQTERVLRHINVGIENAVLILHYLKAVVLIRLRILLSLSF